MFRILSVYGGLLLRAMGQTLLLALCGLFFACILGLIFGLLSVLKNRVCNIISTIFVDVIRGVPMIVLAYMIYFGIPQFVNGFMPAGAKFTLTALQAGTIALALNCGAYMAEIIRAGIQSVDPGQMEAARSLLWGPSGSLLPTCRWGMRVSSASRNRIPSQNPAAAGAKAQRPIPSHWSMAGMSRLHTEAATITPAAKPERRRCTQSFKSFFKNNTQPAPAAVPRKGMQTPRTA